MNLLYAVFFRFFFVTLTFSSQPNPHKWGP
jgi:hypothetical protein